ncbi:class I glutamine amidotransferase-like protein [Leucosporidium creatinivorum]|uniref:Class I glutamine amidotransferase-like protein n=1 Tax=Leucosporidium creatinivorum TaxID=106004 RepID=A0A1Y2DZQ6_9BASI|nr:class I glutamine amidotransferase-like protein [Leucosporidium creatinivorum]
MPPSKTAEEPYHIAVCLFPGFQLLDVCGPLDVLNILNYTYPLRLTFLSTTLDPVTTQLNPNSPFEQRFVVNGTYSNPPGGIKAILVPGGGGTRNPPPELIDYLRREGAAPSLEFLLSVCTGSALLAQAGLLDGKKATSNKRAFEWVKSQGPKVEWVQRARWVVDGSTWTSSGVSAGIDMALGWISSTCGEDVATTIADQIEHEWHRDASWDPFADLYAEKK